MVTISLTNPTFCPHSVFMCFVWISEQTAIISLYSINWLVCITEMECVYCAVRTGCLSVLQSNLIECEGSLEELCVYSYDCSGAFTHSKLWCKFVSDSNEITSTQFNVLLAACS